MKIHSKFLAVLAVVAGTLASFTKAQEPSDRKGATVASDVLTRLTSPQVEVRESALATFRAQRDKSELWDDALLLAVYRKIIELESPSYCYRVMHTISEIPNRASVLDMATNTLRESQKATVNELIAALAITETRDRMQFQNYFSEYSYDEIPLDIMSVFSSSQEALAVRSQFAVSLITDLDKAIKSKNQKDFEITRNSILQMRGFPLPELHKAFLVTLPSSSMRRCLSAIIGAIGSTDSFQVLSQAYIENPIPETAIALGACMGSLSIRTINLDKLPEDAYILLCSQILRASSLLNVKPDRNQFINVALKDFVIIKADCMRRCAEMNSIGNPP